MAQKKHNDVDFITEFINIYKDHTALWKIKSPEYSNKPLKEKGYAALTDLYKRNNIEPVTKDIIKKKISSLRSSFRRELKKIKYVKSGTGGEEAEENEPSLWYYNLLLFTADQEETRNNISNDINVESELQENENDNSDERPIKRKANGTKEQIKDKVLKKAWDALTNEDEYDAYAVTVAVKLRKLSEEQRLYCENIINTALFKAALNQLTEHTTLTSSPLQPSVENISKPLPTKFNISSIIKSHANTTPKSFVRLSSFHQSTNNQSQNHDHSQLQNYYSLPSQNYDLPEAHNYDLNQSQNYHVMESQNYNSLQSKKYCSETESFDVPQSQTSDLSQSYSNVKQFISAFNPQE